jgi:hypothetical protein
MKKLSTMMPSAAALFAVSSDVLAHPGHDHGQLASPMVFAAIALGLVAVVGAGIWASRQHDAASPHSSKQEK